jgi:hypothetical protein
VVLRLWLIESRPWRLSCQLWQLTPNVAADPNAAAADTHVDGDPFTEDPGVDNDEHSKLPDPPPHPRQPFN